MHRECVFTSKASKLMKLAMANPSTTSSSHDTDSLFLRRGGLCLPSPGRHVASPPPAPPSTEEAASRSEPEDSDVAPRRCCCCSADAARSTLRRCRSRSRWDRDRRLCLNPPLRLGPSMVKKKKKKNPDPPSPPDQTPPPPQKRHLNTSGGAVSGGSGSTTQALRGASA